ncbi:MAG: hypothetical protein ACOC3I_07485 [Verrucomicrobiota bacterium]
MPVVTNLLQTPDLDPPMGDLFSFRKLATVRSVWTEPRPEEADAPERRIIHAHVFAPHGRATVYRITWQQAPGYHKCGSHQEDDWVVDLRILTLDAPDADWRELKYLRDLSPAGGTLDLDPLVTCGLILEVRRCGIDDYWTPWNLAAAAFSVEGCLEDPVAPRRERLLQVAPPRLEGLPDGLSVQSRDGQVFYRSRWLQVGFVLGRPGCSHLALDQDGEDRVEGNLLQTGPGRFHQGPMLSPVGRPPIADPAVRFDFAGETEVSGNTVCYRFAEESTGQRYEIRWTVAEAGLTLEISREADRPLRAWHSAAWRLGLDPQATPCHLLAAPDRAVGQTGSVAPSMLFHAPGQGSFAVQAEGAALARLEVFRPRDRIEWELKCGEVPMPEGDWLLPAGRFTARWEWSLHAPDFALADGTPAPVRAALRRVGHTGLSFRPDTATLSNNGASMHCPISMDTWSTQTVRMGELLPGLPANALLQASLERWLEGGPGYAGGNLKQGGELHSGEDEYLMTGTAALLGLAEFAEHAAPREWINHHAAAIRRKLEEMQERDLDGDGLIESAYRTGVSGSGQWSTAWFDVISYGWKDAFSNALLSEALQRLARASPAPRWPTGSNRSRPGR